MRLSAIALARAGTAQTGAAAVFGAGQPDMVANGPQQRGRRIGIDRDLAVVQGERNHVSSSRLPLPARRRLAWSAGTRGRLD